MEPLARDIAQRAHALDPQGLDAALRQLGISHWPGLVPDLAFEAVNTGGDCMMLVAELPGTGGHQVGITGGEAELPQDAENFWLGILDPDGDELYFMLVAGGQRQDHVPV